MRAIPSFTPPAELPGAHDDAVARAAGAMLRVPAEAVRASSENNKTKNLDMVFSILWFKRVFEFNSNKESNAL